MGVISRRLTGVLAASLRRCRALNDVVPPPALLKAIGSLTTTKRRASSVQLGRDRKRIKGVRIHLYRVIDAHRDEGLGA